MRKSSRQPMLAESYTGIPQIDEAAANLLWAFQDIQEDSDGEETPRSFNLRMREAAASNSSFHASPLTVGGKGRIRTEVRGSLQQLGSASMPDLSKNPGALRNAGQSMFQQDVHSQPGLLPAADSFDGYSTLRSTMQSTMGGTMGGTGAFWKQHGNVSRRLHFQIDELNVSKDEWSPSYQQWQPHRGQDPQPRTSVATGSTAASSSDGRNIREDPHLELQSLRRLHAKVVDELADSKKQLLRTQAERQHRGPQEGVERHNEQLAALSLEVSQAVVEKNWCKAELLKVREELDKSKIDVELFKSELGQQRDRCSELSRTLLESKGSKTDLLQAMDERDQYKMELELVKPELEQQMDRSNGELVKMQLELSRAFAERDKFKAALLKEWGDKDQWPEAQKENAQIGKLRFELSEALSERDQRGLDLDERLQELASVLVDNYHLKAERTCANQFNPEAEHPLPSLMTSGIWLSQSPLSQSSGGEHKLSTEKTLQFALQQSEEWPRSPLSVAEDSAEEVFRLRSELNAAMADRDKWKAVSVAAAAAEDELPKVLAHCSRQEELLEQLQRDFVEAQKQLMNRTKVLEELHGTSGSGKHLQDIPFDGQMLSTAYATLTSLRSAHSSFRSNLRESSKEDPWAMEAAGSTWQDFSQPRRRKSMSSSPNRMSRSQVAFQFD